MTYTPAILDTIGLAIFTDTLMAKSTEEAQFLWRWAVEHKRAGVSDNEAVFFFFQMIAWKNPDLAAGVLKIKPAIIRRRCKSMFPGDKEWIGKISEKQFKQAVMGKWE